MNNNFDDFAGRYVVRYSNRGCHRVFDTWQFEYLPRRFSSLSRALRHAATLNGE